MKSRRGDKVVSGEFLIGYWLQLRCEALELDLEGSATKLLYDLEMAGYNFRSVIERPDVELRLSEAVAEMPRLDMRGGPLLVAIMQLQEAIEESDLDEVAAVVKANRILRGRAAAIPGPNATNHPRCLGYGTHHVPPLRSLWLR